MKIASHNSHEAAEELPLVSDTRLDPEAMEAYACGLNAMVYSRIDAEGYG